MPEYVRYDDGLERELDGERQIIDDTIATMRHTLDQSFEEHRHGTSGTHAKSHGLVTGTLTVADDLPPELAQGLFAAPGSYEVVVRIASEPGALDPDTVQRARGVALKVMNVSGDMLEPGWTSQDFLFNTWPVIPQGDAKTYYDAIVQRDKHYGNQLATKIGTTLHHPSPKGSLFDKTPNIHPLAFTYYSQGAFRYGDYVAKFAFAPATPEQADLAKREVSKNDPPGVLSQWVREYFAERPARFHLQVQLLTDVDAMPIEDASVEWSEDLSPYRTVATVELPVQDSFSPARRVFGDDVMSWRIWNGRAAHRPLGSINRLRKRVYDELGAWRHAINAVDEVNPTSVDQVPN